MRQSVNWNQTGQPMYRRTGWVLALILFALVSAALHSYVKANFAFVEGEVDRIGNIALGEPAPDFSLPDIDGNRVSLSEFRERKVVVLAFWTIWCSSCDDVLDRLQKLSVQFGDRGVEFLPVNVGQDPAVVRGYLEELSGKFNRRYREDVPWDEYTLGALTDLRGEIRERYGLPGIPVLAIAGTDGRIIHIESGFPSSDRRDWLARSNWFQRVMEKLSSVSEPPVDHDGPGIGIAE